MSPLNRVPCQRDISLRYGLLAASFALPDKSALSSLCGSLSFAVWLFAQSPQILINYRRGSVEGLSLVFLGQWMAGDVTNLLGCILTDQLTFQKVTAGWFCLVDVVLLAQYAVYSRRDCLQGDANMQARRTVPHSKIRVPYKPEHHNHYRRLAASRTLTTAGLDEMYKSIFSPSFRPIHAHKRSHSYSRAFSDDRKARTSTGIRDSYSRVMSGFTDKGISKEPSNMSASADLGLLARRVVLQQPTAPRNMPWSPTRVHATHRHPPHRRRRHSGPWNGSDRPCINETKPTDPTAIEQASAASDSTSQSGSVRRGRTTERTFGNFFSSNLQRRFSLSGSRGADSTSLSRSQEILGEEAFKVAIMLAGEIERQQSHRTCNLGAEDLSPLSASQSRGSLRYQADLVACPKSKPNVDRDLATTRSSGARSRVKSRAASITASRTTNMSSTPSTDTYITRHSCSAENSTQASSSGGRDWQLLEVSLSHLGDSQRDRAARHASRHLVQPHLDHLPRIDFIASGHETKPESTYAQREMPVLAEGVTSVNVNSQKIMNTADVDPLDRAQLYLADPIRPQRRSRWRLKIGVLLMTLLSYGGFTLYHPTQSKYVRLTAYRGSSKSLPLFHCETAISGATEMMLCPERASTISNGIGKHYSNPFAILVSSYSSNDGNVRDEGAPSICRGTDNADDGEGEVQMSLRLFVGRFLSWLCTLFYLTSRLPQIYTNHTRRSVAGLSILLFMSAFTGNLLYSISIVTNPLVDSKDDGRDYWRECLPFLLGSAGTLFFDAVVIAQWWVWGGSQGAPEDDDERAARKCKKKWHNKFLSLEDDENHSCHRHDHHRRDQDVACLHGQAQVQRFHIPYGIIYSLDIHEQQHLGGFLMPGSNDGAEQGCQSPALMPVVRKTQSLVQPYGLSSMDQIASGPARAEATLGGRWIEKRLRADSPVETKATEQTPLLQARQRKGKFSKRF